MKRKDILTLVGVAVVSAVISLLITTIVFSTPKNRASNVPTLNTITTTFPDVKNDPAYKGIFNTKALDPTEPVQIGNSQNQAPFNGSQ